MSGRGRRGLPKNRPPCGKENEPDSDRGPFYASLEAREDLTTPVDPESASRFLAQRAASSTASAGAVAIRVGDQVKTLSFPPKTPAHNLDGRSSDVVGDVVGVVVDVVDDASGDGDDGSNSDSDSDGSGSDDGICDPSASMVRHPDERGDPARAAPSTVTSEVGEDLGSQIQRVMSRGGGISFRRRFYASTPGLSLAVAVAPPASGGEGSAAPSPPGVQDTPHPTLPKALGPGHLTLTCTDGHVPRAVLIAFASAIAVELNRTNSSGGTRASVIVGERFADISGTFVTRASAGGSHHDSDLHAAAAAVQNGSYIFPIYVSVTLPRVVPSASGGFETVGSASAGARASRGPVAAQKAAKSAAPARHQSAPKVRAKCAHGRRRSQCKDCGGGGVCAHARRRNECKDCGGSGICGHGRRRSQCKVCGGSGICEHGRRRSQCKDCLTFG